MAEQGFTLTSPEFTEGGILPAGRTCEGRDESPELRWMHAPEGTRSFALIVDDPDAPNATFTHWVLFDIPEDVQDLPSGVGDVGVGGKNDFQHDHYGGPCPPPGHGQHRYYFRLYALDVESLGVEGGAARGQVEEAMGGHVLGTTALMGRYERSST